MATKAVVNINSDGTVEIARMRIKGAWHLYRPTESSMKRIMYVTRNCTYKPYQGGLSSNPTSPAYRWYLCAFVNEVPA